MSKLSDEEWKSASEDYKSGETLSVIAARYGGGISERGLLYGLRKRGVTNRAPTASVPAIAAVALSDEKLKALGVPPADVDLEGRRKLANETAERSAALLQAAAMAALEGVVAGSAGMSQSQVIRALDSLSNCLSRAAKTRATALGITDNNREDGELPVLVIQDLTGQEIAEIRRQQEAEASGDPDLRELDEELAATTDEDDCEEVFDPDEYGGGNDA